MAEIILPPEENEETPQAPELNIDKPTENSKVITIEFEAKKTNKVSTKDTNQQLYTTDTDAWFEFKETSLEGANGTYSVVFRNRHDGSIFQRTGDVVDGVAYYKIPHQEIRHAGAWRGQIVYTLSNGDTTAREFDYDVKGHILDGKDVREIVVEDFETLMSQLRSMKDNAEQELADLVNTANQNETDRQAFFDDLVEDIDVLQANYQELLDTGVLQTNINTKLEALEEEYAPKLTEVAAQLAQTTNLAGDSHSKNTIITPKLPTGKGFIVITDDDGGVEILDKLLPLSTDYDIPITLGAVVKYSTEQTDKYLTKEQLKDLQDTYGWEIASHSMTHPALHGATRETAEYEMGESRRVLGSWGLDIKNYIAPFGQIIEPILQEVASKYYNTASTTSGGPHYRPIMNHQVRRVPLGSFYGENEGTLEFYKSKVDEAFENDGLLVWMTHAWDEQHDATQDSNIRGMIEYAKSLGIPFGTMQEGFERYGNMLEIRNRRQIGNDGKMFGFLKESSWIVADPGSQDDDVMFSTTPKQLTTNHEKKVLKTHFVSGLNQPFPENNSGTLVTYLTTYPGDAFQQWHPYNSPNKVYYRSAISETEWDEFKLVGEPNHLIFQTTYSDGAILMDTTPGEIANFHGRSIVREEIANSDNQNFPENKKGTLITFSNPYFGDVWQKWHPYQKPQNVYYRHGLTQTTWSDFVRE